MSPEISLELAPALKYREPELEISPVKLEALEVRAPEILMSLVMVPELFTLPEM